MATTNEDILDAAILQAVHSQRFSRGLAKKIVALLNSADAEMLDKLTGRLAQIAARGYDVGPTVTARVKAVLDTIREVNSSVYSKIADGLQSDLVGLSETEATAQANLLTDNIAVDYTAALPTPSYLKTLVTKSPVDGFLMKSWIDQMSANRLSRVEKAIRIGLATGETTADIVSRIKTTVLPISRRSAETLTLTAASTVSQLTRMAVYEENDKVIKALQWVSVLDDRTTPICQHRDGETWPLGTPHPVPPAHPRCRSVVVPVTKSWDEIGLKRKNTSPTTRASMNGKVAGSLTYPEWLKSQSDEVQNTVLGEQRAALFRDGKVSASDLYRDDGSYRSLAELRRALGIS